VLALFRCTHARGTKQLLASDLARLSQNSFDTELNYAAQFDCEMYSGGLAWTTLSWSGQGSLGRLGGPDPAC